VPAHEHDPGEPELDAAHVDAAWRDILANYGERATLASPEEQPPTVDPAVDPAARTYAAPEPEPVESADAAPEPEWWEREEHFTPPEPPPAGVPRGPRGLAWAGALGLPVLAIVLTFARIAVPGWLGALGLLAFVGSLGYLFATMPHGDDDNPFDGNNGAVV